MAIFRSASLAIGQGLESKIADAFNEIVASNRRMADELERVGLDVGQARRTRQRVS